MCDFRARLIEHARSLGACNVRIEHGGGRGAPRRFRRHPHLTGEINGKRFAFPIKSRPRDASHGYRLRYLRGLEAYLREVGQLPTIEPSANGTPPPVERSRRLRKARRSAGSPIAQKPLLPTSSTPTRLSRDPWGPLRALHHRLAASQNHPLYAARGNEQSLLQELIDTEPPVGGLAAYVADTKGEHDPSEE